jgi:hypothetical protein
MATGKVMAHDANALFRTGELELARGRGVSALAILVAYSATPGPPIGVHGLQRTLAVAPVPCSARALMVVRFDSFSSCFSLV